MGALTHFLIPCFRFICSCWQAVRLFFSYGHLVFPIQEWFIPYPLSISYFRPFVHASFYIVCYNRTENLALFSGQYCYWYEYNDIIIFVSVLIECVLTQAVRVFSRREWLCTLDLHTTLSVPFGMLLNRFAFYACLSSPRFFMVTGRILCRPVILFDGSYSNIVRIMLYSCALSFPLARGKSYSHASSVRYNILVSMCLLQSDSTRENISSCESTFFFSKIVQHYAVLPFFRPSIMLFLCI